MLHLTFHVGIIKRIFINIAGDEFPSNVSWIIDDIIDILNASKIRNILTKIDKRGKKDKDPVIFFYEDFLNYYEPQKRKHLGVYYTPRPIVNFIVNSIHSILKKHFDKPKGLAEDDVDVLDPAIGTGTFFWIAFLAVLKELKEAGLSGMINDKIEKHLLKHFYGFEILITPYVISHLKLTDLLQRWKYKFKDKDRIQIYLTNTLEPSEIHGLLPFLREITEESRIANEIKTKKPILVVIGNPPYSVSSSNKSKWIMEKMKDYKKGLNEKNIQPLDDDYIKFIRFAQWKIEQNGQGIVGFITNNSYLDGIIHRQMRKNLFESFDRIYILNLHGSARREENLPPNISKDENVFDIQQGVAIAIFVKNDKFQDKKVFYADLWGARNDKYHWLDTHTINNVKWQELEPIGPYYFFIPKRDIPQNIKDLYGKSLKLTHIFGKYSIGVVSGDDKSRLSFEKDDEHPYPYDYRPFDKRYINLYSRAIQRPRLPFMNNFKRDNIGLVSSKQSRGTFNHSFVTTTFACKQFICDASYVFPLYLYSNGEKKPNINPEFLKLISEKYGKTPSPEEIFYYIYAVLYSPTYRKKYEEFLKYDFPCIPFVNDYEKFKKLASLGKELVELHLMRKKLPTNVKFDTQGSNIVEKIKYENGKIWINKEQYFDGISKNIWNFYIGGYQVLDKWLKSRKGRKLGSKDIETFLQIIEIINQTIKIMNEINKIKI